MTDAIDNSPFAWLNQTLRADIPPVAKNIASVLVVQFRNHKTGLINPSMALLAEFLDISISSVKRAIKALAKAGLLSRTEGRGSGNSTRYRLHLPNGFQPFVSRRQAQEGAAQTTTTPAESAPKRGHGKGFSGEPLRQDHDPEKGSSVIRKGVTGEPSYINQKNNQKTRTRVDAGAREAARVVPLEGRETRKPDNPPPPRRDGFSEVMSAFREEQFEGSAIRGLRLVEEHKHPVAMTDWGRWITDNGLPGLYTFPLSKTDKGRTYWALPWIEPPKNETQKAQALRFFQRLLSVEAARHAAE